MHPGIEDVATIDLGLGQSRLSDLPALRSALKLIERASKSDGGLTERQSTVLQLMIQHGPAAVPEAIGEFLNGRDREIAEEKNALTVITGLIDYVIRRAILLDVLRNNAWHLSQTADVLGFADASSVLREIKRAGLEDHPEYQRARAVAGHRSGHKARAAKPLKRKR